MALFRPFSFAQVLLLIFFSTDIPEVFASSSSVLLGVPRSVLRLPRGGSSTFSGAGVSKPQTPGSSSQRQQYATVLEYDDDDEDEKSQVASTEMIDSFLTRESRNKFIARVYIILVGQLTATAGACTWFGMNPQIVRAMHLSTSNARIVPALSLLLSTISWIWMCYSPSARRESPKKWGLLALFTLGEALTVGFLSSFYRFGTVVSAMMSTALATAAVSGYTYFNRDSKRDLSQWGAGLSSAGMIFLIYGLLGLAKMAGWSIVSWLPYNDMFFAGIGAIIFSFFLAYHSKLVVGGKHTKFQFHEDDYVFASMVLFSDIINIFLYILQILGNDKD